MGLLAARLRAMGVPCETLFIPYAQHAFDFVVGGFSDQILEAEMLKFLAAHKGELATAGPGTQGERPCDPRLASVLVSLWAPLVLVGAGGLHEEGAAEAGRRRWRRLIPPPRPTPGRGGGAARTARRRGTRGGAIDSRVGRGVRGTSIVRRDVAREHGGARSCTRSR